LGVKWSAVADPNEIAALKASFRGALRTADALAALKDHIEALTPSAEPELADLEELDRVTAAHAIASAALRGLVATMLARRGARSE
jgi:hypothetical protein